MNPTVPRNNYFPAWNIDCRSNTRKLHWSCIAKPFPRATSSGVPPFAMTSPSLSDPETPSSSTHAPPPISFLTGSWHVIQSTLPMWKDKRNVRITYAPLPATNTAEESIPRLDDTVEYQALGSDKIKTVHGIDTPSGVYTRAWDWRGKGWLKIASSHWEVVEWSEGGEEWAVIWFQKTLFTPEGMDIFSREKEGLREETVGGIKRRLGGGRHKSLSEGLFEVKRD